MTDKNEDVGYIDIEVTETVWSTITINVNKKCLEEYDCANLREFRDKIRLGDIDPFALDPTWNDPDESHLQDYEYGDAEAHLPDGTLLDD
jgi:hypothetical protein